jgi:hyperosmotically inducible protein
MKTRPIPEEFPKAQAVYDDRMRAAAYIDDSVITITVKAALVRDPDVKAFEVSVKSSNGFVLLSGFVDSEEQARRAREIAALIEGVKRVRSNLVVKS